VTDTRRGVTYRVGASMALAYALACLALVSSATQVTASEATMPPQNRWAAYATSVNPGDGLQFASTRVGLAVSWEPTNGLDQNLAAGPDGLVLAWPTPAVLVTRDGGSHWQQTLSAPGGFWGVDALSPQTAWAVGVGGLSRTQDGGRRWIRAGEPTRPLVRVAFVTPSDGFGLTVAGRLVETHDSGSSWQASGWAGRAQALCAGERGVAVIADQGGGIWRSGHGFNNWRQVAPDLPSTPDFSSWWVNLSCQGTAGVELAQAFCEYLVRACGTEVISYIRVSSHRELDWPTRFRQSAAEPAAGGVHTQPDAALDVPLDRASSVGSSRVCLLGYPLRPPATVQISCTRTHQRFASSRVPRLPLSPRTSSLAVQGLDFLNYRDGWLLLDEYTAARTPRQSAAQTEVWSTANGGGSWHIAYASRRYHPAGLTPRVDRP
jgi:hypothetical protein